MRNARPTYGRSRSNLSSHDASSHSFDAIKTSADQVPSAEDMLKLPPPEEILQFKYDKHCYSVSGFTPPAVHGQWTTAKCNRLVRYWDVRVRKLSNICTTYKNQGETMFDSEKRAQKERRDVRSIDFPNWSFQNADDSFTFWNDVDIGISSFTRPPLIDTEWYGLKPLQHDKAPHDIPTRSRFNNYLRHPLLRLDTLLSSCKSVDSRQALEAVFSTFTMALLCRPVNESEEKKIETLKKMPKENCRVKSLRSLASYATGKAYVTWKGYDATEDEEDSWYDVVGDLGEQGKLLPEMIRGHVCQVLVDSIRAGWLPTEFAQVLILQSLALQRQSIAVDLYNAILEYTRYTYHPRAPRDIAPSPFCSITFSPYHLFSSMLDKLYQTPQILLEGWLSQVLMEGLKEIHLHPGIDSLALRFVDLALGIETWQTELHKRRCLSQKIQHRQNRRRSKTIGLALDQPPWLCTLDINNQNDVSETTLKIAKHLIRLGWSTSEYNTERACRSRNLVYRIAERIRQWSFMYKPSARDESMGKLRKVKVLILIFSLHGSDYYETETRESITREIVRLLLGATIRHAESEEDETLRSSEVDIKDIADELAKYLHKTCSPSENDATLLLFNEHAKLLLERLMISARGVNSDTLQDTNKPSLTAKTPLRGNHIYEKRKKFLLAMFVNHASTELYRLRNTTEWNEFASIIERQIAELKVPHQNTITADDLKTPRFSMLVEEEEEEEKKEVTWRYEEMLGAWIAITPKYDKPKPSKQSHLALERFHGKPTLKENMPFSSPSKKFSNQSSSSACSSRSNESDNESDSGASSDAGSYSSFNEVMSCNTTRPTSVASSISPRSPPSHDSNISFNSDIVTSSTEKRVSITRNNLKKRSNHFSPINEAQNTRKRLRSNQPKRFVLDHVLVITLAGQSQDSTMENTNQHNKTECIIDTSVNVNEDIFKMAKANGQVKAYTKAMVAKRRKIKELTSTSGMTPQEKLDYLGKKYPPRWCARRSGPPPTTKDMFVSTTTTSPSTYGKNEGSDDEFDSDRRDDYIDLSGARPTVLIKSPLVLKQNWRARKSTDSMGYQEEGEKSNNLHDELEFEMQKDDKFEKKTMAKRRRIGVAPAPKSVTIPNSNKNAFDPKSHKQGRSRLDTSAGVNTPKRQEQQQCAPSSSPFGFGPTPMADRTMSNMDPDSNNRRGGKPAKTRRDARGRVGRKTGRGRGRQRGGVNISSDAFP